jgi:GNAT superfamily N-acetyltransferase
VDDSDLTFYFKRPADLSKAQMDRICALVEGGGAVAMDRVRSNLVRAFLIGYVMDGNRIIATSCLKHPRPEFIRRLNRITGLDFTGCLERGYTAVLPAYQGMGLGTRLLAGLTARAGRQKIFSLISEDNKATQAIALKTGTRKLGTYYSENLKKEMGVWMPEGMTP